MNDQLNYVRPAIVTKAIDDSFCFVDVVHINFSNDQLLLAAFALSKDSSVRPNDARHSTTSNKNLG